MILLWRRNIVFSSQWGCLFKISWTVTYSATWQGCYRWIDSAVNQDFLPICLPPLSSLSNFCFWNQGVLTFFKRNNAFSVSIVPFSCYLLNIFKVLILFVVWLISMGQKVCQCNFVKEFRTRERLYIYLVEFQKYLNCLWTS